MSERKTVLISGANKGIGLETARQLGKQGFTVLLGARDLAKGEQAAETLKAEGIDVRPVKLDVTAQADIDAVAKLIDNEFDGRLDVLVNNAGVWLDATWGKKGVSGTPVEELRETFETNLFAAHALTTALLPALKRAPAARIVNVSSILGSVQYSATPDSPTYTTKVFAYNASKAALNMFTTHLAYELRRTNIKVNSAHPGWVKTDMGTDAAPLDVSDGAKTTVDLATVGPEGPTGGFFHLGKAIPW